MAAGARGGDSLSGATLECHAKLHQLHLVPPPSRLSAATARPPSPKSWPKPRASGRDAGPKHPQVSRALPERSRRRVRSALRLPQPSSWRRSPDARSPFGNDTCEVRQLHQLVGLSVIVLWFRVTCRHAEVVPVNQRALCDQASCSCFSASRMQSARHRS